MFPERIETERLVLERLCHDTVDHFEYYDICSADPGIEEVTEHTPWSPHDTPKETKDFVDYCESEWDEATGANYVIRPNPGEDGAGDIAGACDLTVNWERRTGELGIWLRKRFWGRGYSGERAAALLALAFDRLDLDLVKVSHEDGNEQSKRAVEKYVERFGGQYDGIRRNIPTNDGRLVDYRSYSILREQYRNAVDS